MNNKSIIEQIKNGERLKFLFFWGHTPKRVGEIDKSCFSQWYPLSFNFEGVEYKTAEHWMMSEKARLFGDEEILQKILLSETPGEAKKLGREVKLFEADIWDENKYRIVCAGTYLKFSQHDALKYFLLNTKDRVIVEASPLDAIWGIGMAENHPQAEQPEYWLGENLLGYALMDVREKLKTN